jgi:hypothetical protein
MVTDELKKLLLEKKIDLIKELDAINVLLGFDNIAVKEEKSTSKLEARIFSSAVNNISKNIEPKNDNEIWKDYILKVMKIIGGRMKSRDIADAIFNANQKNATKERVFSVTRDKLGELVKDEKVIVEIGFSRKIGNIYEVIDTM